MIVSTTRDGSSAKGHSGATARDSLGGCWYPGEVSEKLSRESLPGVEGTVSPSAEQLLRQVLTGHRPLFDLAEELQTLNDEESEQVAVALMASYRQSRLLKNELQAQTGRVETLLNVANALTSQLDLRSLIQTIMRKACGLLDAERATLFLVDEEKDELWSKAAEGGDVQEIRFPRSVGIAGRVATTGELLNIVDAYQSDLFNPEFDRKTGFKTRTILCVPIKPPGGEVIGVMQLINKRNGPFMGSDELLLQAFGAQSAIALENAQLYQRVLAQQKKVESLLKVANALTSQLDLTSLIQTIMGKAREILDADRATLFLIDRERKELWSKVAQGEALKEIRMPQTAGIAGHVATTGRPLNIPDAYDSDLFNPAFDKQSGYKTKSILCMPIRDRDGEVMGVTQLINKARGVFTEDDEQLLAAFSAQAAIALQNAQLFESVLNLKDYLESVLNNLSNGVLSVDRQNRLTMANRAAKKILELAEDLDTSAPISELLGEAAPMAERFQEVVESRKEIVEIDRDYQTSKGTPISLNLNIQPLKDSNGESMGGVGILEDMTSEKRTRSMMTRLLSKDVAEQLMSGDWEALMKGSRQDVTILFSDIRSYTTLTEQIGAQETVEMLNEYFSYMVDVIFNHGGTLDKFIGDALMAIFGAPVHHPKNAIHGVHAALEMFDRLKALNEVRTSAGKVPIRIGLGLSSGEVLCGTIGSEKKMEYTAIGDGVNLSSRLEGATKQYGVDILISEFTYRRAATECRVRQIDWVKVKGKLQPVTVYELLGLREAKFNSRVEDLLGAYDEGMRWVGASIFDRAQESFQRAVAIDPEDKPSRIWLDRTTGFVKTPPSDDWDGTYTLTEK